MAEQTQRGQEDRQREDETMRGQPVDKTKQGEGSGTSTTRDRSVQPAVDSQREGHAQGK